MDFQQHVLDVLVRAGKTFVETFIATFTLTGVDFNKGLLVGVLGALVSAVWTTAVKLETAYKGDAMSIIGDWFDDLEDHTEKVGTQTTTDVTDAIEKLQMATPTPPVNVPVVSQPSTGSIPGDVPEAAQTPADDSLTPSQPTNAPDPSAPTN